MEFITVNIEGIKNGKSISFEINPRVIAGKTKDKIKNPVRPGAHPGGQPIVLWINSKQQAMKSKLLLQ
jgi:hypothetical protein